MDTKDLKNRKILLFSNIVTILIVAMMLLVFQAYAMPDSPIAADDSIGMVSYLGQLLDADGESVDGGVDITFKFYTVPEGGSALWSEAHTGGNAVPVNNGLFHVFLGSLTPIPASVWSHDIVYLGVKVGSDPEMTPRQPVGRVAYALAADRALTADRAYGLSAADGDPRDAVIVSDDGHLKIPNGGMCIDSDGACSSPGPGGLRVGTLGIRGSDSTKKNLLLVPTDGNVGIGRTTTDPPQAKLDVNGDISWSGHLSSIDVLHTGFFAHGPNADNYIWKNLDVPSDGYHFCFLNKVEFGGIDNSYTEESAGCMVEVIDGWWQLGRRAREDSHAWCQAYCVGW